jgi:hypothetical protein
MKTSKDQWRTKQTWIYSCLQEMNTLVPLGENRVSLEDQGVEHKHHTNSFNIKTQTKC